MYVDVYDNSSSPPPFESTSFVVELRGPPAHVAERIRQGLEVESKKDRHIMALWTSTKAGQKAGKAMTDDDLMGFHRHLVVFNGQLHLLEACRVDNDIDGDTHIELTMLPGSKWAGSNQSLENARVLERYTLLRGETSPFMFDFGFVGSYLNEYDAVTKHLARPRSKDTHLLKVSKRRLFSHRMYSLIFFFSLLFFPVISCQAVADPTVRAKRPDFPGAGLERPDGRNVPINSSQFASLVALEYEIEAIQGPPGTGKSTIIFHIIDSVLTRFDDPPVALVTCVQVGLRCTYTHCPCSHAHCLRARPSLSTSQILMCPNSEQGRRRCG